MIAALQDSLDGTPGVADPRSGYRHRYASLSEREIDGNVRARPCASLGLPPQEPRPCQPDAQSETRRAESDPQVACSRVEQNGGGRFIDAMATRPMGKGARFPKSATLRRDARWPRSLRMDASVQSSDVITVVISITSSASPGASCDSVVMTQSYIGCCTDQRRAAAAAIRPAGLSMARMGTPGIPMEIRHRPAEALERPLPSRRPLKPVDATAARLYTTGTGAPPRRRSRAQVAELVDALVSGTSGASRGGSSPLLGTNTLQVLMPSPQRTRT